MTEVQEALKIMSSPTGPMRDYIDEIVDEGASKRAEAPSDDE